MLAKPSAGAAASGTIWKFDTLCEHLWVRVKRHAIHHGCIVYIQKIRGRLLQEFIASWNGREHSTCCEGIFAL